MGVSLAANRLAFSAFMCHDGVFSALVDALHAKVRGTAQAGPKNYEKEQTAVPVTDLLWAQVSL